MTGYRRVWSQKQDLVGLKILLQPHSVMLSVPSSDDTGQMSVACCRRGKLSRTACSPPSPRPAWPSFSCHWCISTATEIKSELFGVTSKPLVIWALPDSATFYSLPLRPHCSHTGLPIHQTWQVVAHLRAFARAAAIGQNALCPTSALLLYDQLLESISPKPNTTSSKRFSLVIPSKWDNPS